MYRSHSQADLTDLSLLPSWGPTKLVEADLKPLIHRFVDGMVFVTDLLTAEPLLQSLHCSKHTSSGLPLMFTLADVHIGPKPLLAATPVNATFPANLLLEEEEQEVEHTLHFVCGWECEVDRQVTSNYSTASTSGTLKVKGLVAEGQTLVSVAVPYSSVPQT